MVKIPMTHYLHQVLGKTKSEKKPIHLSLKRGIQPKGPVPNNILLTKVRISN